MNREIKFRAYDKDYERMTYFDDEDYLYQCPFILRLEQVFKKDSNYDDYEDFEYKDVTDKLELMQYTGLKDKNGKEIYEGDIVKIHKHSYDYGFKEDEIGQIKFLDGAFGFYREKTKNEYYFNDLSTENGYGELEYYEVIGNIYENPELLGGE